MEDLMTNCSEASAIVGLTQVSVNVTGGLVVLTSASGNYDIDLRHGVIHVNVSPPAFPSNGGPRAGEETYVARGTTTGGDPVALVGLMFIGKTQAGVYKFSHNFGRLELPPEGGSADGSFPATNLRIASQKDRSLTATAPSGTLLFSPGFPSQLIALDAKNQPGKGLKIGSLYAIAGTGIATQMNMQFDHTQQASDGKLFVFYQILGEEGESETLSEALSQVLQEDS